MSGNLIFSKTIEPYYELVYNYDDLLSAGETIKACTVFVNGTEISGLYDDRYAQYESGVYDYDQVFTFDPEQVTKETILVKINNGVLNSGYNVEVTATTNRRNEYTKGIDVTIDDYAYPNVYNDFEYRFLVDDTDIYLLPAFYENTTGFDYNTEYNVHINKDITSVNSLTMLQSESLWFTSKYCPMFTSYQQIVMLLGPEAEKFTVDTINRYIHRNSREAIDLVSLTNGAQLPYDHYGCTPDGVPYDLRKYVECKTAYDLLNLLDRLRLIDGTAAGQTKTLGDMTIKYNGAPGSSGGSGGGDPKKDLYDCFMGLRNMISNGKGSGINNAVRGKYDTSKGFPHPAHDINHNRVSKPRPDAYGPWSRRTF